MLRYLLHHEVGVDATKHLVARERARHWRHLQLSELNDPQPLVGITAARTSLVHTPQILVSRPIA